MSSRTAFLQAAKRVSGSATSQQLQDGINALVTFVNDIQEDISCGSNPKSLLVHRIVRQYEYFIGINEALDMLHHDSLPGMRQHLCLDMEGIPASRFVPGPLGESSVSFLSLSPPRTIASCLHASTDVVAFFDEETRPAIWGFLQRCAQHIMDSQPQAPGQKLLDERMLCHAFVKVCLSRPDGCLLAYDLFKGATGLLNAMHQVLLSHSASDETKIQFMRIFQELLVTDPTMLTKPLLNGQKVAIFFKDCPLMVTEPDYLFFVCQLSCIQEKTADTAQGYFWLPQAFFHTVFERIQEYLSSFQDATPNITQVNLLFFHLLYLLQSIRSRQLSVSVVVPVLERLIKLISIVSEQFAPAIQDATTSAICCAFLGLTAKPSPDVDTLLARLTKQHPKLIGETLRAGLKLADQSRLDPLREAAAAVRCLVRTVFPVTLQSLESNPDDYSVILEHMVRLLAAYAAACQDNDLELDKALVAEFQSILSGHCKALEPQSALAILQVFIEGAAGIGLAFISKLRITETNSSCDFVFLQLNVQSVLLGLQRQADDPSIYQRLSNGLVESAAGNLSFDTAFTKQLVQLYLTQTGISIDVGMPVEVVVQTILGLAKLQHLQVMVMKAVIQIICSKKLNDTQLQDAIRMCLALVKDTEFDQARPEMYTQITEIPLGDAVALLEATAQRAPQVALVFMVCWSYCSVELQTKIVELKLPQLLAVRDIPTGKFLQLQRKLQTQVQFAPDFFTARYLMDVDPSTMVEVLQQGRDEMLLERLGEVQAFTQGFYEAFVPNLGAPNGEMIALALARGYSPDNSGHYCREPVTESRCILTNTQKLLIQFKAVLTLTSKDLVILRMLKLRQERFCLGIRDGNQLYVRVEGQEKTMTISGNAISLTLSVTSKGISGQIQQEKFIFDAPSEFFKPNVFVQAFRGKSFHASVEKFSVEAVGDTSKKLVAGLPMLKKRNPMQEIFAFKAEETLQRCQQILTNQPSNAGILCLGVVITTITQSGNIDKVFSKNVASVAPQMAAFLNQLLQKSEQSQVVTFAKHLLRADRNVLDSLTAGLEEDIIAQLTQ